MTRCPACPCPADVPCLGPTTHPMFCGWARAGENTAHIVNRSRIGASLPPVAAPLPPPPIPTALTRLAIDCVWRDTNCSSCRGVRCWANLGNREGGRATTLARCEECVSAMVPRARPA